MLPSDWTKHSGQVNLAVTSHSDNPEFTKMLFDFFVLGMVLFKLSMQVNGLKAKLPAHISQSHSTHKASTCTFRYLKGNSLPHSQDEGTSHPQPWHSNPRLERRKGPHQARLPRRKTIYSARRGRRSPSSFRTRENTH